jgi:hypothetical protein
MRWCLLRLSETCCASPDVYDLLLRLLHESAHRGDVPMYTSVVRCGLMLQRRPASLPQDAPVVLSALVKLFRNRDEPVGYGFRYMDALDATLCLFRGVSPAPPAGSFDGLISALLSAMESPPPHRMNGFVPGSAVVMVRSILGLPWCGPVSSDSEDGRTIFSLVQRNPWAMDLLDGLVRVPGVAVPDWLLGGVVRVVSVPAPGDPVQ